MVLVYNSLKTVQCSSNKQMLELVLNGIQSEQLDNLD